MTTACSNIGARGIRRRRGSGVVSLGIFLGVLALLLVFDAPRRARLLLLAPAWIAGLSLFQAREKT